ncbi:hypothetical protein BH708_06995 [Brachybacterium sp. P6-10-X1]|uniref:FHA domain-containing protein n=1 Tax=Brachybacterium sp. P6-10-X1 TaxID=1903186 RepID=UPI000971ACD0|nr:FHA domain-containing protein [Brachybacterium sp. P6-10-X1]APX32511.1 hypothetical protein BH708_06995 [Brachybacterium sp. P6-10-X1]
MTEETEATAPAPLLGLGTWTQQGPATLVVREAGWAVLVPGTRKEVIEAAWTVLGDAPPAADLLDALVEKSGLDGVDDLAAILFAIVDGTTATLGVKGKTPLAVYTAEGSQQVAGTDDEPFVLTTLEGVHRIAFGDLPAEEPVGAPRVSSGIARVRGFVQMVIDPAEMDEDARAALVAQVEEDGRSIEDPEAAERRANRPAPAPRPSTGTSSSSSSSSRRTPKLADRKPGEMPPSISRGGSSRAATPEPASDGPNMFDGLFAESTPAAPAAAPEPSPPSEQAPAPATPSELSPAAAAPAREPAASAPDPATPASEPAASTASADAPAVSAASATPAADDSESGDGPAGPGARPAAEPVAAGQATGAAPVPTASEPPRRRLVSTSLFDRKRPGQAHPATEPAGAPATTPPEDPADAPVKQPAASAAPAPEPAASIESAPGAPSEASAGPASPALEESPTPEASPTPPAAPTPPPSIPTPAPPEEDEEVVSSDTQVAPLEDEAEPETEEAEGSGAPVTQIAPVDDGEQVDCGEPGRTPRPRRADPSAGSAPTELDNTGAYDDLFGKTVFRRIEDAAVRPAEDDDLAEDDAPGTPAEDVAAPPGAEPEEVQSEGAAAVPDAPAPASASASSGGDFIDWVPGVGRKAPEIAQTAARRAAEPQHPAPAYPQVHMADRPPAPQPGEQPSAAPQRYDQQSYSQQPYGQQPYGHQHQGPHPGPQPSGEQRGSGYAGQQIGHPGPAGSAPQHGAPPSDPGAAGDRHANAPHPVAPSGPPAPPSGPPSPPSGPPGRPAGAPGRPAGAPSSGDPAAPFASSASGVGQPPTGAVALSGLVCPQGHANSPERSICRACGTPLHGTPRTVARPPLGAIELSTGDRFVLDRSAIVGRRPRASRVSVHDVPQLVTVPSPQQDISRSHLELRLEGWHVVALDLGTTNGTTLYREGADPLRLRPREGVVLHEGDVLDLGDGVHLRMRERA